MKKKNKKFTLKEKNFKSNKWVKKIIFAIT